MQLKTSKRCIKTKELNGNCLLTPTVVLEIGCSYGVIGNVTEMSRVSVV
jgi:hypothetical protein